MQKIPTVITDTLIYSVNQPLAKTTYYGTMHQRDLADSIKLLMLSLHSPF
jgi:hypothetical protein